MVNVETGVVVPEEPATSMTFDDLLTLTDVAKDLNLDVHHLRRLAERGRFPARKIGGYVWITTKQLVDAFVEARKKKGYGASRTNSRRRLSDFDVGVRVVLFDFDPQLRQEKHASIIQEMRKLVAEEAVREFDFQLKQRGFSVE